MAIAIRLLAVPLSRIVIALVLWGLALTSRAWMKPLIAAMTHKSSFLGIVLRRTPLGVLVKGVDWVSHKTEHALSHHAVANIAPLARYQLGLAHRTVLVNGAHVTFADVTAESIYRIRHNVMPREIRRQVAPVAATAAAGVVLGRRSISLWRKERNERRRSISHINTKLGALALGFLGIDALVKHQHAKAHHYAHTHTIPQIGAELGKVAGQTRANTRDVAKLKRALGVAALTALVTGILARAIPSWRCSNFRNIRRLLKCSHWRFLEAVLFVAVDALLLRDLCQLVASAQTALESIVPRYIEPLVLDAENFICGGRDAAPWGIVASDWEDVPARTWGV